LAEYQNPQHEPGSERRLLLIFLVTFVVMLLAQPLLKKYFPTPPPPQQQPAQPVGTAPSPPANAAPPAAAVVAPVVGAKQASNETETVIENELYRITFTNRGAHVKSWILKKYDNEAENGRLDLVNTAAASQYGYPLSLWTYDQGLRTKLDSVLYVSNSEGKKSTPASITFEYADPDVAVRKTFSFDDSYVVKIETSVTSKGSPVPALPAWPAGFGDQATPAFYAAAQIEYQNDKSIERVALKKISGGATIQGPFHWAGPTDQYFGAVFIPDDPASVAMVTLRNPLTVPRDAKSKETTNVDVLGAAVGNLHGPSSERAFVGPKELDDLKKVRVTGVGGAENDLTGMVDFGTFSIIAKPLFVWLRWTYYHLVSNWGWAILLQTLIITIALMPLRVYQVHSMYKMQKIAPQMKAIQDKYKKYSMRDPRKQEMQKEIYALQQKEGANPLAGCLPMLIQIPFLWAYYRMLATAIDLRHAHFLWVHDLSAAEPFPFVLPILMVVSSLITQKMTPQAGMDPQQQRMMNVMMPLMMGFIFFRLAAGLNLYYAAVNLINIAQQAVMNRTKLGREMRELMAKRARKKEK
jgi:YidC/Oxa1 family membrane protein insertase